MIWTAENDGCCGCARRQPLNRRCFTLPAGLDQGRRRKLARSGCLCREGAGYPIGDEFAHLVGTIDLFKSIEQDSALNEAKVSHGPREIEVPWGGQHLAC